MDPIRVPLSSGPVHTRTGPSGRDLRLLQRDTSPSYPTGSLPFPVGRWSANPVQRLVLLQPTKTQTTTSSVVFAPPCICFLLQQRRFGSLNLKPQTVASDRLPDKNGAFPETTGGFEKDEFVWDGSELVRQEQQRRFCFGFLPRQRSTTAAFIAAATKGGTGAAASRRPFKEAFLLAVKASAETSVPHTPTAAPHLQAQFENLRRWSASVSDLRSSPREDPLITGGRFMETGWGI